MARRSAERDETTTRGTGNVFADVGYPDADERWTKLGLAQSINAITEKGSLTQAAAATLLGINQPKVSDLANYRLDGFSVDRARSRTWRLSSASAGRCGARDRFR